MRNAYETLKSCVEAIKERVTMEPEVAIVLGSGLGGYAAAIDVQAEIPYTELEGFPVSTVEGHDGRFIFGHLKGVPVVLMKGRVHYYEGYSMEQVVMPIRIMGMLGAKTLILTNASGGINLDFQAGNLMLITDHISTFVPSPLIGKNIDELGPRFPDMSHVYNRDLQDLIRNTAKDLGISLKEGVYVQCSGPNYESPTEIRMLRMMGADAVGMSTVCEAIAANHMDMEIVGISCVTNMAAGILDQPLNHKEVQEAADQIKDTFETLITGIVAKLAKRKGE